MLVAVSGPQKQMSGPNNSHVTAPCKARPPFRCSSYHRLPVLHTLPASSAAGSLVLRRRLVFAATVLHASRPLHLHQSLTTHTITIPTLASPRDYQQPSKCQPQTGPWASLAEPTHPNHSANSGSKNNQAAPFTVDSQSSPKKIKCQVQVCVLMKPSWQTRNG